MNGLEVKDKRIKVISQKSKMDMNPKANVFINNIGKLSPDHLQQLMEEYGSVISSKITPNGYGYIQFEKPEEAEEAIKKLNGRDVEGQVLELEIYSEKKKVTSTKDKFQAYVKNLPQNWEDQKISSFLQDHFKSFGPIQNINIWKGKGGDKQACIDFESQKQLKNAIKSMNGFLVEDKKLEVDVYLNKEERK